MHRSLGEMSGRYHISLSIFSCADFWMADRMADRMAMARRMLRRRGVRMRSRTYKFTYVARRSFAHFSERSLLDDGRPQKVRVSPPSHQSMNEQHWQRDHSRSILVNIFFHLRRNIVMLREFTRRSVRRHLLGRSDSLIMLRDALELQMIY